MWRSHCDMERILKAISKLAGSYVPEWKFDVSDPDIGSVIAMIFAEQIERARREREQLPSLCMGQIASMLGIRPAPPVPARTTLVMEVDEAAREGVWVKKGSRFFGEHEGRSVEFQTTHDLLAVHATLQEVLGISGSKRTVTSNTHVSRECPISVFGPGGDNIYTEEARIIHPLLWGGAVSVHNPLLSGVIKVKDARVRAYGYGIRPQLICDGMQELKLESAAIFGEELSPYKECYIGQDEVFQKAGARITCTFELEWGVCDTRGDTGEEAKLKLVRKNPSGTGEEKRCHVVPGKVGISYYNGGGFRQLNCEEGTDVFRSVHSGSKRCRITFLCPGDWAGMSVCGYDVRCIRLQILKADGCFAPGAVHHYPIVSDMECSYHYGMPGVRPESIQRIAGNRCEDLMGAVLRGEEPELFLHFPYREESMLFGFDRKFPQGPVSLYLDIAGQRRDPAAKLSYSYSTQEGFRPLQVIDHTAGLTRSGIIRFLLPPDAGQLNVEGRSLFFIRVTQRERQSGGKSGLKITGIRLNGVEAVNTYVSEEKEYSIERAMPYMEAPVAGEHIIDTKVWVNERNSLSERQRDHLIRKYPDRVRAGYDIQGELTEFFVRWRQVDHLSDDTGDGRVYRLDQKRRRLCFGGGIHARIPEETEGTAWKTEIVSCDGSAGNAKREKITEPAHPYVFLRHVSNPQQAYGGSDGETDAGLIRRGKSYISTYHRIVTESDLIREAMCFSDQILEAAVMRERFGLSLIIRLRSQAPGAFERLSGPLESYLRRQCAPFGTWGDLCVREPVLVKVSVSVWVSARGEAFFEAKERLLDRLDGYLLKGEDQNSQWGIGRIPIEDEIRQILFQGGGDYRIRYFQVTASYTDEKGDHEAALDKVAAMKTAVCVSGAHHIYMAGR